MLSFLSGGGELGALMRAKNWSDSPFGPTEDWPQSLRSAVSICLGTSFPIAIYWGPDLALLYNDAWSSIPGEKHPWALGRPGREVWPEIWDAIGPLFDAVQTTGEGVWQQDQLLPMHRHGYTEECYFNFTFSPIRGEAGKVEGIFNAVVETTFRVISERRERVLRELAENLATVRAESDVFEIVSRTFDMRREDVPFCLVYRVAGNRQAELVTCAGGIAAGGAATPQILELEDISAAWPLADVVDTGQPKTIDNLAGRFASDLPGGLWPEPTGQAYLVPITTQQSEAPAGVLIAGVSPRRALDDDYRGFIERAAGHIATALGGARAYEEERRRAESLAEIDRAKTLFFSNVSHEFRTPLTLMLGPIEELLAEPEGEFSAGNRQLITTAHRNGQRLLKLVNSLLDFSRIEAGRVQASYEATDLAAFTAELASNFRSATEKAGLELDVDCPSLPAPVYVDREMWEKIVLNLVSNAFKFTFEGRIHVSLRAENDNAVLTVRDTGTGIPETELPRLFERFHRIHAAKGRSFEGSGIGLALVQELVRLHGGAIAVESKEGEGTAFHVSVPFGKAHLPAELLQDERALASTSVRAYAYVEEALHWLPDENSGKLHTESIASSAQDFRLSDHASRARVLLAEDNADMRSYVQRLLATKHEVEDVADGAAALEAARARKPDLILTDVMMPRLDGFGLLRALRADSKLRDVPVIVLSARAGEEASIEGLHAGADDYIVKPFSARELVARVDAALAMAKLRKQMNDSLRESEERFRLVAEGAPVMLWMGDRQGKCLYLNKAQREFWGVTADSLATFDWNTTLHPEDLDLLSKPFSRAMQEQTAFSVEARYRRAADGEYRVLHTSAQPRFGGDGEFLGMIGVNVDVTDARNAEDALRESETRFRNMADHAPVMIWTTDASGQCTFLSRSWYEFTGQTAEVGLGRGWLNAFHDDDRQRLDEILLSSDAGRHEFELESRLRRNDGRYSWTITTAAPWIGSDGQFLGCIGSVLDITERKNSELERARLAAIVSSSDDAIVSKTLDGQITTWNEGATRLFGFETEEIVGQSILRLIPPERHHEEEEIIGRIRNGERIEHFDTVRMTKDGRRIDVSVTISPLRDGSGKVVGASKIARDVTARRQVEEGQRRLNELLERRVADAIAERETVESQLRQAQKMEAVGKLTGGIAHDFNNLLQVVGGNLQLLSKDIAGNRRAEERVSNALAGVSRGSKLASQLLAFGRRQPLAPRVVSLGRLLRGMDDMLRRVLGEGIELDTVVAGGLWNTFVDASQLENAVLNLAINARDAMGGHGKLTIEAGNSSLDDDYVARHPEIVSGQYVMLAVTDTGSGIPADIIEHVFEPFFTTKPEGQGTGLGLSMVYGFVKQSGGHIKIYSEPGEGTTVRIYLPRSRQQEDVVAAADTVEPRGGSETVLVVEDDEDVRRTVAEMLADLGYRVLKAKDGDSALAIVESGVAIDLLFTDVVMPGKLRSPELARKTRERLPNVAVLFTSGYTQNAIVHEGRLDEGVELLSKPYSRDELARKIRHVLRDHQQRSIPATGIRRRRTPLPASPADNTILGLRVLLVEDEVLIRMSTSDMLKELGHSVLEAGSSADAMAVLADNAVDVLLTDMKLPDGMGDDLAAMALARFPQLRVIFASGQDTSKDANSSIEAIHLSKPYDQQGLKKALTSAMR